MAIKKPLVLGANGKPQQIQSGDSLGEVDLPVHSNSEATTINKCQVVYIFATDSVKKARANAQGTLPVYGFVADTSIAAAATGGFQTNGNLAATTVEWDAVTGQTGGLTPNAYYFASDTTSGAITTTPPTTGFVQIVGVAASLTTMKIMIEPEIKL